jgi:Domain of unknown function (DUF4145)
MKCPHCQVEFHGNPYTFPLGADDDGTWGAVKHNCPACSRTVVEMVCCKSMIGGGQGDGWFNGIEKRFVVYPRRATRPAPPSEVPSEFAQDYIEASLVLADSPKASAALSRRCLQHILREKARVKKSDLAKEIDEVLASRSLPSHLAEAIDAIRNIGNFAAHPIKSTSSGEIVPVEPGEAEWTLDVLDGLFDFYFVQPEVFKKRRAALDAKLSGLGKPPMK